MSFNRAQFLIGVLGADASLALAKAASRSEYLSQMIVPRTILALLEAVPAFTGTVPGFDDCSLTYEKSEKGFTGNVTLGEDFYKFEDANIFHVAGALATAMNLDSLMFGNARIPELQRLGKSIDLMAKAHLVGEDAEKKGKTLSVTTPDGVARSILAPKNPPKNSWSTSSRPMDINGKPIKKDEVGDETEKKPGKCEVCGGKGGKHNDRLVAGQVLKCRNAPKLEKKAMGEGSGQSAGPVAPAAPVAPTANAGPATTQQKLPKAPASAQLPKPPKPVTSSTVKLTRSEKTRACPVCSVRQFNTDDKFVGCLCFRALAKSVDVTDHGEYSELRLGEDWDRETVVTFLEAVGRR